MMDKIIECCSRYNACKKNKNNLSEDDICFLENYDFDFAKSIVSDFGYEKARKIAKLILAVVE